MYHTLNQIRGCTGNISDDVDLVSTRMSTTLCVAHNEGLVGDKHNEQTIISLASSMYDNA